MNVSMMDSYNLAWKLAYHINGVTPPPMDGQSPSPLLGTYYTERHANAQRLIDFDRKFSSGLSDKVGTAESKSGLSHSEFVDLFSTGCGFTSGCGVEYDENLLVKSAPAGLITGKDFQSGILRPGRCLLNVKLKRFADGWHRDVQDDLPSTGRFRLLSLLTTDLLDANGVSATSVTATANLVPQFAASLIEQIIIYPRVPGEITWRGLPMCMKEQSEMTFYNGYELEDVYGIYGVDSARGALVVVRPDGYVGLVVALSDTDPVDEYLSRVIARAR